METPRLVGVGVHTDRGKHGAQMRKGQVRGKLGRNIMALCIMSKCGGNVVVSERKVTRSSISRKSAVIKRSGLYITLS